MPRTVPEWLGKTDDTPVPQRVLERLWKACGGKCQGCGLDLRDQAWDADHIVELILGGENRESNLQVLGLKCCHRPKTREAMKEKWRASRVVRSHSGINKPRRPMAGSRASNMKKCVDGRVIDRRTGKEWGK